MFILFAQKAKIKITIFGDFFNGHEKNMIIVLVYTMKFG